MARPKFAAWLLVSAAAASQLACGGYGNATAASGTGGGEPFVPTEHRAWPQMEQVGDGVMKSPRVVLVQPETESALESSRYADFVTAIPTSAWYASWAPGVGVGAARPSRTVPGPPLEHGTVVDDASGAAYIDAALAAAGDPTLDPDGESIYVVPFPDGVEYSIGPEYGLRGRHLPYGTLGDGWAFAQKRRNNLAIDGVTAVISHEVAEAITNTDGNGWQVRVPPGAKPWDASAWAVQEGVDDQGRGYLENGDFCTGTNFVDDDGRHYQRIYDNAAAAAGGDPCVPAIPDPYYNVTVSKDWYAIDSGGSLDITVTGWTTAPTTDFETAPSGYAFDIDGATFTFQTNRTSGTDMFNDGQDGLLHIEVPAGNPSGGLAVITLWSQEEFGTDGGHLFPFGIYVR